MCLVYGSVSVWRGSDCSDFFSVFIHQFLPRSWLQKPTKANNSALLAPKKQGEKTPNYRKYKQSQILLLFVTANLQR